MLEESEPLAALPMLACFDSVSAWLAALSLEQYESAFKAKGYDSKVMLAVGGLDNDDLDCLGVYTPLHRRLLKAMAGLQYSDQPVVSVPRHRDCNGIAFFVVESCFKFSRSSTLKRHADFRTFDELLRLELQPHQLAQLPTLPPAREGAPLQQRREALQEYLTTLSSALGQSPLKQKLLHFLDLNAECVDTEGAY